MVIAQQRKYKILLIGDNCIDVYQYGTIDRLSPEAPVPIFVPTYKEEREGMVGNVYKNLVTLGCDVTLVCGHPSVKTRFIDSRSRQQVLRMDEDVKSIPVVNVDTMEYDAVVISDYNKGVVSYELIEKIISSGALVFVDTKKTDLTRLEGAWVKINELEYSKIKTDCSGLIVTRGAKGVDIINHRIHIEAPNVEVVDVTGAGDTFLAALVVKFLETVNIKESVEFANKAASVTVQHFGVYAPTLEEIQ